MRSIFYEIFLNKFFSNKIVLEYELLVLLGSKMRIIEWCISTSTVFNSVQKLIQEPYNSWKLFVLKCINIIGI